MSLQTVTLVDQENNKSYDILLSTEDAIRAGTDLSFACALLRNAILQQEQEANGPTAADEAEVGDSALEVSSEHEEGTIYRWNSVAIKLLVSLYEEHKDKFESVKYSQKECWETISREMRQKGFLVTGPQCSSKWKSLKKTFKSVKDHNGKSGNDKRTWEYYEILENVFGKNAWCKPAGLASSSGVSSSSSSGLSKRNYSEDSTSDSESSTKERSSKKSSTCSLLARRLQQKEEHAKAKQKRHEERMAVDRELLEILKKYKEK